MKNRIKEVIKKFEGSEKKWGANTRFARKIGAGTGLVGDWLNGKSEPLDGYRRKICENYPISRRWLDSGKGDMLEMRVETHPAGLEPRLSPSPMLDRGAGQPAVLAPQTPEKVLYSDKDLRIAQLEKDAVIRGLQATIEAQKEEIGRSADFQSRVGEALKHCEEIHAGGKNSADANPNLPAKVKK